MRRVEISDNDGNKYDMASSLATYLVNRKTVKFNFGDWLESLTDAQILRLLELDYAADLPGNTAVSHILNISLIAISAELHTQSVSLDPEIVSYVGVLAGFESLRRRGFVYFTLPLRLSKLDTNTFIMTDEGIKAADDLYNSIPKQ